MESSGDWFNCFSVKRLLVSLTRLYNREDFTVNCLLFTDRIIDLLWWVTSEFKMS